MEEVAGFCVSINTRLGVFDPVATSGDDLNMLASDVQALLQALDNLQLSDLVQTDVIQTAFSTIVTLLQLYAQEAEVFHSIVTLVWKYYGSLIRKFADSLEPSCCEELFIIFTYACTDGLNHILSCSFEDEKKGALKVLALLSQRLAITLGCIRSVPNEQAKIDAYSVLLGVYGFVRLHDFESSNQVSTLQQNLLQSVRKVLRPVKASYSLPCTATAAESVQNGIQNQSVDVIDFQLLIEIFRSTITQSSSCGFIPVVLLGLFPFLIECLSSTSATFDTYKVKATKIALCTVALLSLSFEARFQTLCSQDFECLGEAIFQQSSSSQHAPLDSVLLLACGLDDDASHHYPLRRGMIATAQILLTSHANEALARYCLQAQASLYLQALSSGTCWLSYVEHTTNLVSYLSTHALCQPIVLTCLSHTIAYHQDEDNMPRKRKRNDEEHCLLLPWPLLESVMKNLPLFPLLESNNQQVRSGIEVIIREALNDLQGRTVSYKRLAVSYCLFANIISIKVDSTNGCANTLIGEVIHVFKENKEINTKTLQFLRTLTAQLELYSKTEHYMITNVNKISGWSEQMQALLRTFMVHQLPKGVQRVIAECMSRTVTCLKATVQVSGAKDSPLFQASILSLAVLAVTFFDLLSRARVDSSTEQEIVFALKLFAEARLLYNLVENGAWKRVDVSFVEIVHRSDWAHQLIMTNFGYEAMQQMLDSADNIKNKQRFLFNADEVGRCVHGDL